MATILLKKRDTTGAPSAGDLTNSTGGAEIAVNTFDKRLYAKDSGGSVVEIGTAPSTINIDAGTIDGVTLGTNSAITEAQIDNININGNSIISTNTDGNITLDPNGTGTIELTGPTQLSDNFVIRPTLKDYAIEGNILGNSGSGTVTLSFASGNYVSTVIDNDVTFAFSDPAATGDLCGLVMEVTDGGNHTVTWPASVDWPGGTAPSLTSSGTDVLVFWTDDAGTIYHGVRASEDSK